MLEELLTELLEALARLSLEEEFPELEGELAIDLEMSRTARPSGGARRPSAPG